MALPRSTRDGHSSMLDLQSLQNHGDARTSSITNDAIQSKVYEGYNITPNESQYDESRGKWYQAHTKKMPGSQEEFQNLVRRQSQSVESVMEVLYSPRMIGSKREHIEEFVNDRDASDPERKHVLVYLRLERFPKHKGTKQTSKRTASMQIVIECKLLPHIGSVPSRPLAPHSLNTRTGDQLWVSFQAGRPHQNQPLPVNSVDWNTPQSQGRPSFVWPAISTWNGAYPNVQTANRRDSPNPILPPLTPISSELNGSKVEHGRPLSPCSTVSSDAGSPTSRKMSSSSISTTNQAIPSETMMKEGNLNFSQMASYEDNANPRAQPHPCTTHRTSSPGQDRSQSAPDEGNHTDSLSYLSASNDSKHSVLEAQSGNTTQDQTSVCKSHTIGGEGREESKTIIGDEPHLHRIAPLGELKDEGVARNFDDRPPWFDNLQPGSFIQNWKTSILAS